jgi:phosphoribosylglycinamide formyltransferase-1
MRALIERSRGAAYSIAEVISDIADAQGLAAARDLGVAARALPAARGVARETYDLGLAAAIEERSADLIVLAGFMRILSAQFVRQFAGRILNIHPSLLPKYPGLHTHRRAIEGHDAEHGATVHFVTEQLDGGPRIIQARVNIEPGESADELGARVLELEHRIYPMAVNWFCEGRLRCAAGSVWLDGRPLNEPVQLGDLEMGTRK